MSSRMKFCPQCEASITETDVEAERCTQCSAPITTEEKDDDDNNDY